MCRSPPVAAMKQGGCWPMPFDISNDVVVHHIIIIIIPCHSEGWLVGLINDCDLLLVMLEMRRNQRLHIIGKGEWGVGVEQRGGRAGDGHR